MNIPEVSEHKPTAASCAQNKAKTQDLIQLHERKIKQVLNQNGDKITENKVIKKGINPRTHFQIMNSNNDELSREGLLMVISKKDVIEVEQHVYNPTADDWTETEIPPDTPALMHEIASMVSRDEKRNRMAMARETRLEISRLNEEIDDRDTEEDEQEHTHEIGKEGSNVHTSENDENEENSETESVDTVEYEYNDKKKQAEHRSDEENEEVEMADNEENKGPTEEDANQTLTDTKWGTKTQL